MGIKIVREPEDFGEPIEDCCFCGKVTPHWAAKKNVPVCEPCAKRFKEADVPDKITWWRRGEHNALLETTPVHSVH